MTHTSAGWSFGLLHLFTGNLDGGNPDGWMRPLFDAKGNLYGAAIVGGGTTCDCGTVYELMPTASGLWKWKVLHAFAGGSDGVFPGGLTFDSAGNLYGITGFGGAYNSGTVFKLTPGKSGPWEEEILYQFTGTSDGKAPINVTFDSAGNLYGATHDGGAYGHGAVFKLSPSNGTWQESVLYSFTGEADGETPDGPVMLDAAGNVYGVTGGGGNGYGVVYEVTP